MIRNKGLIGEINAWAMVPTPFTQDGTSIDTGSLTCFARFVVEQGCTGLIALGVIAEPSSLSIDEKVGCLETVADAVPSCPLIGTVMGTDTSSASAEARILTDRLGSRLAGLMVPVSHPEPNVFRAHLRALHESTGLQLMVQDLPSATGIRIETDDLVAAIRGLDFVVAVKCESPPTFHRISRLRAAVDVTCVSGIGGIGLIDDVVSGATAVAVGVTPVAAVVRALTAAQLGDYAEASRLIGEQATLIHLETQPGQSIAIRKEHWRRTGVIAYSTVRAPTPGWTNALDSHSLAHGIRVPD